MYKALVRPNLTIACKLSYPHKARSSWCSPKLPNENGWKSPMPSSPVTSAWHGSSRSKLYEELGWDSLSNRHIHLYRLNIDNNFYEI